MVLLILESEFVFIRLPILNMNLSKKAIKLTGPFQCLYNSWGFQKDFLNFIVRAVLSERGVLGGVNTHRIKILERTAAHFFT